jgi:hypothetical protein
MEATISEHKFATIADAKAFALAGNAIITLQSLRTGAHFTYKIRSKEVAGKIQADYDPSRIWFVNLLAGGSADEGNFVYLGIIKSDRQFHLTQRSPGAATPSVKAFEWFWHWVRDGIPTELVVRHEGRCGRCGRTLTVPESIDRGIGPECAEKMGGAL